MDTVHYIFQNHLIHLQKYLLFFSYIKNGEGYPRLGGPREFQPSPKLFTTIL